MKVIDCVCLNLDSAVARRKDIEASFEQYKGPGWTWTRFPSVPATDPRVGALPGQIRTVEKACFLSHKLALESRLGNPHPVFVLEDDAVFGPHTAELVDRIAFANDNLGWDLLYTDICVPMPGPMLDLALLRRQLGGPADVRLINLRGFLFAGATAYIVSPRGLPRVHAALQRAARLDLPYDLYLRFEINAGRLNAFTFFPFLTTLGAAADSSQVQGDAEVEPDRVWNLFRRMMWVDRDLQATREDLKALERLADDESRAFATLFAAYASGRLKLK